MEKEVKTSKKKTKIVLIIAAALLVLLGIFLFWFFNRKFDVTFNVSDSEKYTIKVKYNHTINEKDIKTKGDLGESFIDWYEVISAGDEEELAKDSFDFSTKIKEEKTLKAVYKEEKKETIKITFDTKGGSKVNSITIEKGEKLKLPTSPTKKGYTFETWTLKSGKTVKNNTKFNEDTTLYAKWEKLEEKISLKLSRKNIHRNGYNTSKAIATVENASGEVTYEINNNICVSIDSKTGDLIATRVPETGGAKIKSWINNCQNKSKEVTVTAKLPSGKSATATLIVEKDLKLEASFYDAREKQPVESDGQNFYVNNDKNFSVSANQTVTWTVTPEDSCVTTGSNNVKSTDYNGTILAKCNGTDAYKRTTVTATTDANQKLSVKYNQSVN